MNQISWWKWLPRGSWRIVMRVDDADEVPTKIPRNAVVLVGRDRFHKWLVFDCPCRRGHRVMLNLDSSRLPHWRITNVKKLTVTPSIDWHGKGASCHYFIRNGRVVWACERDASS